MVSGRPEVFMEIEPGTFSAAKRYPVHFRGLTSRLTLMYQSFRLYHSEKQARQGDYGKNMA
jgi:hypothetical protein